jgi:hypothetical protein
MVFFELSSHTALDCVEMSLIHSEVISVFKLASRSQGRRRLTDTAVHNHLLGFLRASNIRREHLCRHFQLGTPQLEARGTPSQLPSGRMRPSNRKQRRQRETKRNETTHLG